ncbi:MAG: peroxiredoxin family protein [Armatimonadetes bacterium]|nr:peroxiredoxin family protein [Armatimonadota bacterium]
MTKYHLTTIFALAIALVCCSGAWALGPGETAPPFNLQDQFGKTWNLSSLNNTVIVLIVANRDSGRAMGPWVDNLKTKYGKRIQILGLMDLHTVPGIGRGIARSRIRSETKDPLMLDFNGSTAKAYSVSGKYPVAVVIDKGLHIREVQKTNYTDDAFKAITAAVDEALK